MNDENLKPCTPENARERQLKSAEKRKENTQKRKLISQMYAGLLCEKFQVKDGDVTKVIDGEKFCKLIVKRILNRADSSSVAMLRELREATEGSSINISGAIKTEMESTEQRVEKFKELMGEG